jgi:uncharacterized membrane protein YqjE
MPKAARGAAVGSIALFAFAFLVWKELHHAAAVLGGALLLWIAVAAGLWRLRKWHVYASGANDSDRAI